MFSVWRENKRLAARGKRDNLIGATTYLAIFKAPETRKNNNKK